MALYAFSMGMTYVSAFTRAEKSATKYGFPEDTKTYQLISGTVLILAEVEFMMIKTSSPIYTF